MRKYTLLLTVMVCFANLSQAQDLSSTSTSFMQLVSSSEVRGLTINSFLHEPASVQRELYKIPKLPGERMMKVGKMLTAIGAGLVVGGVLVYNQRDPNYYTKNTYGNTYGDDPHEAGGQLLVGAGIGMIVPGVMVWVHGASKYRKHEEKNMQALYVPAGKLGLAYRF